VSGRHRFVSHPVVRTVLSVYAWFMLGVLVVLWTPLVAIVRLVTAPWDKGRYWAGYTFRKFAVAFGFVNPLWRFHTSGTMINDPRRPYVVVANHESFVDILAISHLKWEMKWLAKKDFFQYPLVGWMLRMAGDIRLVRGNKDSIVAAMDACKDRLAKKTSVMIFPEGTRSRTGELGPFKDGAFRLAIETQTPILPIAVHGAYEALVKGDWRYGVCEARVHVLEAVPVDGMTLDDVPELRERVRALIAAEVATMSDDD
jgi:1-acyl-sn-glycerol-3-phosphate acyltransferase